MAENNEETIEVHVEAWRLLEPADCEEALKEDQSAHHEDQSDPPDEDVIQRRSVWHRIGERPQPRW
uniref:Uncharacterized protein n=1 Tax=Amphimedon queenslandica TaxID=400682 RepID=A0A1X7UXE4_AMPQE